LERIAITANDILFEVETPLRKKIRITNEYWEFIVTVKHPILKDKKEDIRETLYDPDFIRRSTKDRRVFLYYKGKERFLCVVCKHTDGR